MTLSCRQGLQKKSYGLTMYDCKILKAHESEAKKPLKLLAG